MSFDNTLNGLAKSCYTYAESKGFWNQEVLNPDIFWSGELLCRVANKVEEARIKKGEKVEKYKYREPYEDKLMWAHQKLLLVSTEIAEALSTLKENEINEEIADIFIRMFDLAGYLGINLEDEIQKKMSKNIKRPYLHGKKF